MTEASPVAFQWDGEAMIPLNQRFARLCDKFYVVGERYILLPHEERSANSHRHYFASVNSAWLNLPERMAEQFPTSEHLRKYALIKAGYFDERSFVAASKAEAVRLAAFVKPIDDFAIVTGSECTVRVFTAKSQSMRAMGKEVFQKSKTAVLEILSQMLDVEPHNLTANADAAA